MVTIRYGATTVQAGSATTASRSPTNVHDLAVFMWQVNRDVSYTPIHPDSSRTLKNGHDSTHCAAKNEPDPATVELRFRPRPQSTTIHPECFKRFKIVVALPGRFPNRQDSPRIITVLLRFVPMYRIVTASWAFLSIRSSIGVNCSAAGMSRSGTVDESCRHRRSIVRHRIDVGFSSLPSRYIPIHPGFTD